MSGSQATPNKPGARSAPSIPSQLRSLRTPALLTLLWGCVLLICALHGLNRSAVSEFIPIDGDFQNYNGYRRLLAGQVPFRDFVAYLGLGPLFLGAALTKLLGGTFTSSLTTTWILSPLLASVAVYTVARVSRLNALLASTIALALLLRAVTVHTPFDHLLAPYLDLEFAGYYRPGNSARMLRAAWPFLLALGLICSPWFRRAPATAWTTRQLLLTGALLGGGVAWSNDAGPPAALAFALLTLGVHLREIRTLGWPRLLSRAALFLSGAALGLVAVLTVLTHGHPGAWLAYNVAAASAQPWYYGAVPLHKVLTLSEMRFPALLLTLAPPAIWQLHSLRRARVAPEAFLWLSLALSSVISGLAYELTTDASGLFAPVEPLAVIGYGAMLLHLARAFYAGPQTGTPEPLRGRWTRARRELSLSPAVQVSVSRLRLPACLILSALSAQGVLNWTAAVNRARTAALHDASTVQVPALGGRLRAYGPDLARLSHLLRPGETIFSTYASALEVVNHVFQPSGTDYDIHALGDAQREKYLRSFHASRSAYVTTIREDFSPWESWNKRANWDLYRDVLSGYRPVAVTAYNVIWQPRQTPALKTGHVTLHQTQDSPGQVTLTADAPDLPDGVLELRVTATTAWTPARWRGLGLRRLLSVYDAWGAANDTQYNLPAQGETRLPVKLVHGHGQITLSVLPANQATVSVTQITSGEWRPDAPLHPELLPLAREVYAPASSPASSPASRTNP